MIRCNSWTDGHSPDDRKDYRMSFKTPLHIYVGAFFYISRAITKGIYHIMKNKTLRKLTTTAMLAAVSVILGYFAFPIFPQVPFLEYDLCDVAILIASLSFGPVYGVCSSLVTAVFQAFVLGKNNVYGFIMNVISTTAFVLPAAIIYFKNKTKKTAVIGLAAGTVIMTAVMVCFNYLITPHFMGVSVSVIHTLMPFIALFNFIKSTANSLITFFIYKHIGKIIKKIN